MAEQTSRILRRIKEGCYKIIKFNSTEDKFNYSLINLNKNKENSKGEDSNK